MDRLVDEILRRVQERLEKSPNGLLYEREKADKSQTKFPGEQKRFEESQIEMPSALEKADKLTTESPDRQKEEHKAHSLEIGRLPAEFTDSIMNGLAERVADILSSRGMLVRAEQSTDGSAQYQANSRLTDGSPEGMPEVGAVLMKRVLSEKDMISVCGTGVTVLHTLRHAVFTELAKDYVKSRGIQVIRDR